MTRSRIILVHIRCRSTVAIQLLQHLRDERPSSSRARHWQLRNALLHRRPTHFLHPCLPNVASRLQVLLECLLRLYLSVVGNCAQHTHDQHLPRGHRFRLCIAWLSQTSSTRLKYVTFHFYLLGD
jgi:hypothetical protein